MVQNLLVLIICFAYIKQLVQTFNYITHSDVTEHVLHMYL